jgi:pimeloyl-ACP methyl ester carboxylesterase
MSEVAATTQGGPAPLGSKPLVVVSIAWDAPEYKKLQAELLALSLDSKQLVADKSGHLVPLDQPEVVVSAIRQVVEAVQKRAGLKN